MKPYKEYWKNDYFNLWQKSNFKDKKLFKFPEVSTANGLTEDRKSTRLNSSH